jgi:heme/copper-type cytochrome/quinol oxidase subunit 3
MVNCLTTLLRKVDCRKQKPAEYSSRQLPLHAFICLYTFLFCVIIVTYLIIVLSHSPINENRNVHSVHAPHVLLILLLCSIFFFPSKKLFNVNDIKYLANKHVELQAC